MKCGIETVYGHMYLRLFKVVRAVEMRKVTDEEVVRGVCKSLLL